jgi:hypothetical protein
MKKVFLMVVFSVAIDAHATSMCDFASNQESSQSCYAREGLEFCVSCKEKL